MWCYRCTPTPPRIATQSRCSFAQCLLPSSRQRAHPAARFSSGTLTPSLMSIPTPERSIARFTSATPTACQILSSTHQLPYVPVWQFVTRDGAMTTYNLPSPRQFGQNGTFSAFRILEQNVPVFEAFSAPKAEMKLHKSCSPTSSAGDGAMAVPSCSSQMHSAPFCPMTRCKVSNTAPTLSANPARFPPTPGTPTSEVARWSSPAATR